MYKLCFNIDMLKHIEGLTVFLYFIFCTTESKVVRNSAYRQLLTVSVQLEKADENRGDKFALPCCYFFMTGSTTSHYERVFNCLKRYLI